MSESRKLLVVSVVCALAVGFALLDARSWLSYGLLALGFAALVVAVGHHRNEIWWSLFLVVFGFLQPETTPQDAEFSVSVAFLWILAIPIWGAGIALGAALAAIVNAYFFRRRSSRL